MVQLVSLNTRKGKKRQNGGNVAIHRGNGKHKKTVLRERKDKVRKEKQRARGDFFRERKKNEGQGKEQNQRNPHVHIQHAIQKPHNSAGQQL